MGKVHVSVELPASPEVVWAEFSNPHNFDQWLTIHTKWKGEVPSEFKVGTQVSEVVSMLGMANTIAWTVEEYDAPKKLAIAGTGMAGVKVRFTLSVEPTGDGSTATIDAEFNGQMIIGALGKAVEKDASKNLTASLEKFKTLVSA